MPNDALDRTSDSLSSWWGDLCSCCDMIPATVACFCEGCLEHIQEEYAHGYVLGGCPAYDAWCRSEPYPWEVAA